MGSQKHYDAAPEIKPGSAQMVSRIELVSAAAMISIIVGLLLPAAVHHSLNRGVLVLLCGATGTGLILGTQTENSVRRTLANAFFPSLFIPATYVTFLIIRYFVSLVSDVRAPVVHLPGPSGGQIPVEIFGPSFYITALILFIVALCTFVASYILISLTALAARPILHGTKSLYGFGHHGMARVQRLIIAVTGLVAAVIMLWSAFSL